MSAHGCIERINALLAPHNTVLARHINFGDQSRELIQVATEKLKDGRTPKARLMFAGFCPFCGVELNLGEKKP